MANDPQKDDQSGGRTCFVIMPFSTSKSCTEDEWTHIFEEVIRPAVEAADYKCRRSTPTRGNLIKGIIQDLDSAWAVLADLTDRNPNVFYELGVRHALKNRTILIAQHRKDIPFDLLSYANHVYDSQTPEGCEELKTQLANLLADVDRDPDRADNPVSDFLENPSRHGRAPVSYERFEDIESRLDTLEGAISLLGAPGATSGTAGQALTVLRDRSPFGDEELEASWFEAGKDLAASKDARALNRFVRRAVQDIHAQVPDRVSTLNSLRKDGQIQHNKIAGEALRFEAEFAPLMTATELLASGLASEDWGPGARAVLRIAGALVSVGEGLSGLRFSTGLPAYFAWRLVLIAGARSIDEGAFSFAAALINDPMPIQRTGRQPAYRPLSRHGDLFHPEAMLGFADLAVKQIAGHYDRSPHLHVAFPSEEEFQGSLAKFLILNALRNAEDAESPIYPGYRLIPGFSKAAQDLVSSLVTDPDYLDSVSQVFDRKGAELRSTWQDMAEKANNAELGSGYYSIAGLPTSLDSKDY